MILILIVFLLALFVRTYTTLQWLLRDRRVDNEDNDD
jgi:hypothetical protein